MSIFQSKKYDFCVIDFETATSNNNSACSIGIALVKDFEIIDTYYNVIRPPHNVFSITNTSVHGLNSVDTLNAEEFPSLWNDLYNYIENSLYVVSHNTQFDMSVLIETCRHYKIPIPYFNTIDSMYYYATGNYNGSRKLSDKASEMAIELDHHNALSDALAAAQILIKTTIQSGHKSALDFIKTNKISVKPIELYNSAPFFTKPTLYEKFSVTELNNIPFMEGAESKYLFGKRVVLTGVFSISKNEIAKIARYSGAIIQSNVGKKTDFLIEGIQEERHMDENGLVSKQREAVKMQSEGHHIQRISESEFYEACH